MAPNLKPDLGLEEFVQKYGYRTSERESNGLTVVSLYRTEHPLELPFEGPINVLMSRDAVFGAKANIRSGGTLGVINGDQIRTYISGLSNPVKPYIIVSASETLSDTGGDQIGDLCNVFASFLQSGIILSRNGMSIYYSTNDYNDLFSIGVMMFGGDGGRTSPGYNFPPDSLPIPPGTRSSVGSGDAYDTGLWNNTYQNGNEQIEIQAPKNLEKTEVNELDQSLMTDTDWLMLPSTKPILYYSRMVKGPKNNLPDEP